MKIAPFVLLLCSLGARAQDEARAFRTVQSLQPAFPVSQWRLVDLNRDGRTDLLLIGRDGEVRTWTADPASARVSGQPRGHLRLPHPRHTLMALFDEGDELPVRLLTVTPDGAVAYRAGEDSIFPESGETLARRARFRLRTSRPVFAEVLQDINRDGLQDIVVPGSRTTDIWIRSGARFRKAASLGIDLGRGDVLEHYALSNELASAFRVPGMHTEDVNGDGRRDLLVKKERIRSFHLQREDGAIPAEPDVSVNLSIFRDTTPKAALQPGRTLAGSDKAQFRRRDLDGDGIPDYVIAHRRKVWVFHGNKDRPQFTEPTTILKVADDVTLLLVAHLNQDKFADLLLIKVQIPSIASIILALVRSLEIKISALGYANEDGRSFERSPRWKGTLTVRVPPIKKILKNPEALFQQVEDVAKKFRLQRTADFNGDGMDDTALLSEDKRSLEVWFGAGGSIGLRPSREAIDRTIFQLLFEDKNKVWTFERGLSFLGGLAERRFKGITGGREPDVRTELRDPDRFVLLEFGAADLDAAPPAEIVILYAPRANPSAQIFDVLRYSLR
ncbi:MAG: FG-GAP repeat domain-containing protein [Planctomycetota bacterium]